MKKFFASSAFLFAFAAYAAYQYLGNPSATYTAQANPAPATTGAASVATQPIALGVTSIQASSPSDSESSDPAQGDAEDSGVVVSSVQPRPATTPSVTPVATPASTPPKPVAAPAPAPKPKGQYVDGTYTGSVANAYYGNVQVQATVSGGKIASVQFLQYPNDRSTSRYINSQATPILASEAIQAQSAQVNTVSGASDTSAAFQESLAAALSQAKA